MLASVLLLSIIGLFIWFISRKSSGTYIPDGDEDYLRKSIGELEGVLRISPDKTVKGLLEDYKNELEKVTHGRSGETADHTLVHDAKLSEKADVSLSEWYSKNSINLLLYVGAFLIVASASIFVGFQWETLSGVLKASVLTSVAIAFFGFGAWFIRYPKIRDAGNTFVAIGAVLIPVCGSAWFNFVFKPMGVGPGIVWATTSLIALAVYGYLAFGFKNKFYTYASSITSLSLTTSLVNMFGLDSNFYILAGIISSFLLMILSFISRNQDKETQDYTLIPLQLSSQLIMPLSLGAGYLAAASQNKLFTFEAVLSVFLAAAFYVFSYLYFKKSIFMALSEVLFSVAVVILFFWQQLDNSLLMYVLNICAFAYLFKASILNKYNLTEEVDVSLAVGIAQSVLVLPFAYSLGVSSVDLAFLSLMPVFSGIVVSYIKNEIRYFGISSIFVAISVPLFMEHVFKIQNHIDYLSYCYLIIGLLFYVAAVYFKEKTGSVQVFKLSAVLFFALSFVFGLSSETQRLTTSLVLSGVGIHYAWVFGAKEFIYASNFFIVFALYNSLKLLGVNSELYPFYYSALAYVLYGVSFIQLPQGKDFQKNYRESALLIAVITPIVGGLFGLGSIFSPASIMERNSLICAYAATILFGIDVAIRRVANFGYVTSVLGMATFFWQIKYLGVEESLAYTISLGLYFMALAYTRKIKNDNEGRQLLDGVGLFFLLVPPALFSFGEEAVKYSVTLGVAGIALLIFGISLRYKLYKYAGVAGIVLAVLPQTYNYILDLPRWLIVGVGGIIFITVAIVLSLKRKD